jgi:CheY-like chemotaxis protein
LPSGRRKLLVADDSQAVQKLVRMFFGEEGYEVVAVGDGASALRELESAHAPDVLLADAVMPGPDGYELCERVKRDARLRGTPVVLLVSRYEPFNEAEARRVGADTVLTKPFQSIRDLVSKVGSLLGGEPKHDEERARQEEARASDARADSNAAARDEGSHAADASAAPHSVAREDEAARADDARAFEAASSSRFADLGDDDELIEAVPADSVAAAPRPAEDGGARPDSYGRRWGDAPQAREQEFADEAVASEEVAVASEDFNAAREEEFSASPLGTLGYEYAGANGHTQAAHASATPPAPADHHEENPMPAQPSFEARAAGAAAADDTLLDLGQMEPRPVATSAAAAESDDFILDLDDDFAPAAASGNFGEMVFDEPAAQDSHDSYAQPLQDSYAEPLQDSFAEASRDSLAESSRDAYAEAPRPDAPSAFAEAAHGETAAAFSEPATFSEPAEHFSQLAEPFGESAVPSAESAASFAHEASAHSSSEQASRDPFIQDGPQGFASYVEPQGVGSAPRGFVEPEVVSADVPVPAVVEDEFTDGSVEGDLSKAPAEATAPADATAAGHAVLEGHTRVEEPARAEGLSQEAVDAVARRVVELMSDKIVREIAWEVVPEMAELLIRRKLEEDAKK